MRAASTILILGILVACAHLPLLAEDPAVIRREFIFEQAPFPSCHASTIVEVRGGLVAAWFGGREERAPDVGIWVSRNEKGKWSTPVEIADGIQVDGSQLPCWNPVLFQPKSKPLMLFYKVGPSPSRWWGMLRTSPDRGRTWGPPQRLPEGFLGPVKNKPIQLPNGDLLCPSSSETDSARSEWRVHFERTSDFGKTWTKSVPAGEIDAIQPSILTHRRGVLQAVGRSRESKVFETWSRDGGHSWSALTLTDLPNPNSGTDAVTLKDGRQVIVYNHTTQGRTPLNVALSLDGQSWREVAVLETAPGEYSYPAIIQTRDRLLHVTYTWKRERICHVVLNPKKFPRP